MNTVHDNEIICMRKTFPNEPSFCSALTYKLIRTLDLSAGDRFSDVYSVLVIMERGGELESAFVYDVSRDRAIAKEILEKLFAGDVTPCSAAEVTTELI